MYTLKNRDSNQKEIKSKLMFNSKMKGVRIRSINTENQWLPAGRGLAGWAEWVKGVGGTGFQ